jgi:hypothetical protein
MASNRPEAACERPGGHGAYPTTPEAAQGRTAGSLEASSILELVERYCRGEMSAEDYFAACHELAKVAIADELAHMRRERSGR